MHFVLEVDTTVTKTVTQVATSSTIGPVKGNGNSIPSNNDNSFNVKNVNAATPINDHNAEVKNSTAVKTATAAASTTASFVDGTVNYFSYSPDLDGRSFNTVTLTAFALDGHIVGQVKVQETINIATPIVLTGFGEFHSVTIDSTLLNKSWGGIALDNLTIGEVHSGILPATQVESLISDVSLVGAFDPMIFFNPLLLIGIP